MIKLLLLCGMCLRDRILEKYMIRAHEIHPALQSINVHDKISIIQQYENNTFSFAASEHYLLECSEMRRQTSEMSAPKFRGRPSPLLPCLRRECMSMLADAQRVSGCWVPSVLPRGWEEKTVSTSVCYPWNNAGQLCVEDSQRIGFRRFMNPCYKLAEEFYRCSSDSVKRGATFSILISELLSR